MADDALTWARAAVKLLVTGDKHKRIDEGVWDNTAIVSERAEAYRAGHSAAAMVKGQWNGDRTDGVFWALERIDGDRIEWLVNSHGQTTTDIHEAMHFQSENAADLARRGLPHPFYFFKVVQHAMIASAGHAVGHSAAAARIAELSALLKEALANIDPPPADSEAAHYERARDWFCRAQAALEGK